MQSKDVFMVIGGGGFLGRRLVPLILKNVPDSKIIIIDRKRKIFPKDNKNIKYIIGDLTSADILDEISFDVRCIFYLAAVIPWAGTDKNNLDIAKDNLMPIINIIEQSGRLKNLKNFIFSSSVSVYRPSKELLKEKTPICPVNIYGAAKAAGESLLAYLKTRNINVASLRYGSIYGYGQYPGTVLPMMIKDALSSGKIYIKGDRKRAQDFLYCDDAALANILAYKKDAEGVFNIGSGISVTLDELARKVSNIFTNGSASLKYISGKKQADQGYKIDIAKAKSILGFNPLFQIENGLEALKKEMR